jgi:hypothetical protein
VPGIDSARVGFGIRENKLTDRSQALELPGGLDAKELEDGA